jgi:hypothetical protein
VTKRVIVDSFKAIFETEPGSEIRTEGIPETKHAHREIVS